MSAIEEKGQPSPAPIVDRAWKILEHNRTFNTHFDFKFGPILVVASAAVALLGGLLKDSTALLREPIFGVVIGALSLVAFGCLFMTFLNVLAATAPSLTMRDRNTIPGTGPKRDRYAVSLVFFDDIRREYADNPTLPSDAYVTELRRHVGDDDELFKDLAQQIVEIAAITSKKAERVRASAGWLFWGLVSGGAAFVAILAANVLTEQVAK